MAESNTVSPIVDLFDKLPSIIVPPKSNLEVELRFIIDSRKPTGITTKTYTLEQTIEIAKRLISKFKDKPQTIEQTINFITRDDRIRQLVFVRGEQQKDKVTYYKKTKIIEPAYFMHNDLPAYRLNINYEAKIEEFQIKDALARIKLRYSITLDDWRLDITLIKNIATFSNLSLLKEAKNKMLFDINLANFIDEAPWRSTDYIEFELEYVGDIHNISIQSLAIANTLFKDSSDDSTDSALDQDVSIYQSMLFKVATFIKPKQAQRFKHRDGIKQLSNQVVELDKNIYLRDVAKDITNYFITDKIDGYRSILYISPDGSYALSDKETKLDLETSSIYIFDTEFYEDFYYIFDVMVWQDETIVDKPFNERLKYFDQAKDMFKNTIKTKPFIKLTKDFRTQLRDFKKEKKPYKIDGIVLTPSDGLYNTMNVFKYKPIELLSTDFLIRLCPSRLLGIKPYDNIPGKTLYILFSGIARNVYFKLNMRLINKYDDIFTGIDSKRLPQYFPIQFQPSTDLYAYLFWSDNADLDNKVGEFVYNENQWHLHRLREDRQVEVTRGNYFGNNYRVAELNWMSYQDPLVIEDIKDTSYFQERDDNLQKGSRSFNSYVKTSIFKQFKNTNWVMDIASGKGQDLFRYASVGTRNLICLEIDNIALFELIYRKHDFGNMGGRDKGGNMQILCHRLDMTDDFQENIEALKPLSIPQQHINLIVCNFAFHYFLENRKSLVNVIKFINHYLSPGGRFVFTAFDGAAIIRLLNDNDGEWTVKVGDKIQYSIKKQYEINYLEPIGQTIDVFLPFSNLQYYKEYLVNIENVANEFSKFGFVLETDQSFSEYLEDYQKSSKGGFSSMSAADKKYVSLYHYYCFYKKQSTK
jgi:SAM-dependent methyltransferase